MFEQQLVTALAAVRTHRNKLLPVNRLPNEVLSIAFRMMQPNLPSFLLLPSTGSRYDLRTSAWEAVSTVCRKWREASLSSPSLWSIIDSTSVNPYLYLKRSCSVPLTLYAGISRPVTNFSQVFLHAVTASISRFKEVHLDIGKCSGIGNLTMFEDPAPALESLTIATSGKRRQRFGHALPALFNGQTPKLRQLNVEHFTSWSGNHFADLTHLCLYNQHTTGRPTLSQFIDFIETCPRLQELALVAAGPTIDNVSSANEHRLVALDHLRELTIGRWSSSLMVSAFLSQLLLPRTVHMYLWNDHSDTDMDDLSIMIPADCSHLRNMEGIHEVRYQHIEGIHGIISLDGVLYIHDNFDTNQILTAMSRALVLNNLEHVSLHDVSSTPYGRDDWRRLFAALPSLQRLRISSKTSRAAISALSSDTMEIPLCAHLKHLTVVADHNLPALFLCAFAAERAAQQCPVETLTIMRKEQVESNEWGSSTGDSPHTYAPEDFQFLSKYVEHVEHVDSAMKWWMTPPSWPNPAYSWTTRKEDPWHGWKR